MDGGSGVSGDSGGRSRSYGFGVLVVVMDDSVEKCKSIFN